jgi:hypothetical protein
MRLSSAWPPVLLDELVVVGAVEGAGVAPLEAELVEPDDEACAVGLAVVSCAVDIVLARALKEARALIACQRIARHPLMV